MRKLQNDLRIWQCFILHLCYLVFLPCFSISRRWHRLQLNSELYFTFNSLVRYQSYLSFPIHRSTKFRAAFSYTSVKYFNSLPTSIKTSSSLSSFHSASFLSRFITHNIIFNSYHYTSYNLVPHPYKHGSLESVHFFIYSEWFKKSLKIRHHTF